MCASYHNGKDVQFICEGGNSELYIAPASMLITISCVETSVIHRCQMWDCTSHEEKVGEQMGSVWIADTTNGF